MNAVSSSIFSTRNLSPLTSKSLNSVSADIAASKEPRPPTDAVSARLIGNNLKTQATVADVARSGAKDRSSFLSTAITDLGTVRALLKEADGLAKTLTETPNAGSLQRAFAQDNYGRILDKINKTATNSKFDGTSLLDADREVSFRVGSGPGKEDEITVRLLSAKPDDLASGLSATDLSSDANVSKARTLLKEAISSVEGRINTLENAEDRVGTASQASLAAISGLNAAFQAQLEYQKSLLEGNTDDTTTIQIKDHIQAYLRIVALDFNEISPAEASSRVHFDLGA